MTNQTNANPVKDAVYAAALCAAAQAIIERDFKPRPGGACTTAPDGVPYVTLQGRPCNSPSEAVQELENWLRAAVVNQQGDTVWWRSKPKVDKDGETWRARCRLRLGWARDEKPEHTPGNAAFDLSPAYPEDAPRAPGAETVVGQLPRWKCHKVVEADRIVAAIGDAGELVTGQISDTHRYPVRKLRLESGIEVMIEPAFFARGTAAIGDYFVRYSDGYESWSPAKAFEDGYSRETL